MMISKNIKKSLGILSLAVLTANISVHLNPIKLKLSTSVIQTEKTTEKNVPLIPKLDKSKIETFVNWNGIEVFHGYKSSKSSLEETIEKQRKVKAKQRFQSSSGFRASRKTNYGPLHYKKEALRSSAPRVRTRKAKDTLSFRRKVGIKRKAKIIKSRKSRISLRASNKKYGTANAFKNAYKQKIARNAWESVVWAPNRKPNYEIKVSKITIKNPYKSRKIKTREEIEKEALEKLKAKNSTNSKQNNNDDENKEKNADATNNDEANT